MIVEQIELPLAAPTKLTIADILSGNVVRVKTSGAIVMKIKVTGFLLNSTVIGDILNRGDSLVVDLKKGTLYAMQHDREVERLVSKVLIAKE